MARGVWEKRRGAGLLGFLASDDEELLTGHLLEQETLGLFREEWRTAAASGLRELGEELGEHGRLPFPASLMEWTASSYLPEQILVKVDRASMASALECRAPFLDRGLVEFLLRLPGKFHFGNGHGKMLLRKSLPAGVPEGIRWREKRGFTPPMAAWMRTSLREKMREALDTCRRHLGGIVDLDSIDKKIEQHLAGEDHSDELFRWYALSRTVLETTLG